MLCLIIYSDKYISFCYDGIKLFAVTVLPSLLPFFFLTQLLTKTGVLNKLSYNVGFITRPLIRCNGLSFYAFLMSILSGYPIGSRIIYDLHSNGLISDGEAKRTSLLASTSGPLFIIGAVGIGMFNNKLIGFTIYFSHVISAILTAIIFRFYGNEPYYNKMNLNLQKTSNILYESIYNSVISVLIVGGFVSIFYVFSQILSDFKILYPLQKLIELVLLPFTKNKEVSSSVAIGIIECTRGCKMLSSIGVNPLTASLSSLIISFGGVSIIMQSLIYLISCKVKPLFFIGGKIIQSLLAFTLSYLSLILFL